MTGQYFMFDYERNSIKMARTIKLVPDIDKSKPDMIEALKATPFSEHVAREPEVEFKDRAAPLGDENVPPKRQHARRLYVLPKVLENFAYTVG